MKYLLISIFSFCLLFTSCRKEQSANDKILTIIKDSLKVEKTFDKILILQSAGCHVCNKKFAEYLIKNEKSENDLVIISMQNVNGYIADKDISKFKNVVVDKKGLFFKTNVLNNSAAIIFKQNKIDTILNFSDARIYDQNLEYLYAK